jgi:hypothetical protein
MGSSGPDEPTSGLPGREPATQPPVQPGYQPTYVPTRRPEAETVPPAPGADVASQPGGVPLGGVPPRSASDVLRYGPGVPASQAGVAAESVWRTGHRPGPPSRQGRLRRVRRVLGSALTVILLVVAGIVVWLRFFDHPAFHVTEVRITQQTKTSCGVNVTGKIVTNGSAGTVSYQWVFQPQTQAPQPLSQSVTAGQHDVFVTVAVQGQGHGTATQKVTLDVLGPDTRTDSADVTISC